MYTRITFKEFLIENTVRTMKGTPIKRSSWGVGKDIGGFVYFHKMYLNAIPESRQAIVWDAYNKIHEVNGDEPEFNVIKVSKDKPIVSFISSPDFDTEPEPTVGSYINVNTDNDTIKSGKSNSIWHHKWLWVKDDYTGFDVQESMERSKQWLQQKDVDFSRIGKREFWDKTVASKLK